MEINTTIEDLFTYHTPTPEQQSALQEVRDAGKALAKVIDKVVPIGMDQSHAMRKLRETVMLANAGIVLNGRFFRPSGEASSKFISSTGANYDTDAGTT